MHTLIKISSITFLLLLLLHFSSNAQINSGLVLNLPFDGDMNDKSSLASTISNSGSTLVPDRFGNDSSAIYFNGTNNYISVLNFGFQLPNDSITISFWIKPTSIKTQNLVMLMPNDQSRRFSISLFYSHNSVPYHFFDYQNIFAGRTEIANISLDTSWQHFVITKSNSSGVFIYRNGSSIAFNSSGVTFSNRSGDLQIGGGRDGYFQGTIDEFRIYNRVISNSEIDTLYNNLYTNNVNKIQNLSFNTNIFPNPNNGEWKVQLSENVKDVNFELYNMMGQKVNTSSVFLENNTYAIKSEEVTAGMYLLRIVTDQGIHTSRLQIH